MKLHNHDCNVSEINNEEILYTLEFERISRQRYHFENFLEKPEQLDYWFKFLKEYREDKQPVDVVVLDKLLYGKKYYKKFINKEHNWLLEKIKLGLLQNGITHSKTKFSSCPHHMGHASGAFYTSPFKNALILSYDGYERSAQTITLEADSTIEINQTLVPLTGNLNITSIPSGADIYLNDEYRGISPLKLQYLDAGNYFLKLQMEGYQDYLSKIEVQHDYTTEIAKALEPIPANINLFSVPNDSSELEVIN